MDREKVIKGLEHHYGGCEQNDEICPYWQEENCGRQLILDALALLKEQEPAEPILDSFLHKRCPSCRALLKGKYCHECGQAVKWE